MAISINCYCFLEEQHDSSPWEIILLFRNSRAFSSRKGRTFSHSLNKDETKEE